MNYRLLTILFLLPLGLFAQIKNQEVIAFYNLENLFDTINQENVNDGEYTPQGRKEWNTAKYESKLNNMAKVLYQLGDTNSKKGLALVGVCEVENRQVLEDLVSTKPLKKRKLSIIHADSPDKRGIDVAMLYNPKKFKVIHYQYLNPNIKTEEGDTVFTRDVLVVKGVLRKTDTVYVLVNHWPSRYGGEEKSRPRRNQAALFNRSIVDSIKLNENPLAKVFIMGDLNDDPTNVSVDETLNTIADLDLTDSVALYNPYYNILNSGTGTLKYRGKWNLFDQVIFTQSVTYDGEYLFESANIFNPDYLFQQDGDYKGYPLRTFGGKTYLNGYSDHLPVYIILKK